MLAVIGNPVQVSQSLLKNEKELKTFPFIQSTVLCQHGPAAARRVELVPKQEQYKFQPNMGAQTALAKKQ